MTEPIRIPSDDELLTASRQSDDLSAFTTLYQRYIPLVYGIALKYLKDADDADDAVMQLYEELAGKYRNYPIENFSSWLHTCIRNHCLMALRKKNRYPHQKIEPEFVKWSEDFHPFAGEQEEWVRSALLQCIEALPEKQRTTIVRFFQEKRSYKEIEDQTGFSFKMMKSFIQNGKRNLKICLERKGVTSI